LREVLRDLGEVQDHLAYRQPEAPRVLIGQGLGALYALAFAAERPDGVAALVLVSPLLEPRFQRPERPAGLLKLLRKVGPTSPGRIGWAPADLSPDSAEAGQRRADPLVHDVITLRAIEEAEVAARHYRTRGAELAMPTLVLHGDQDRVADLAPVRVFQGPRIELRILPGIAHDVLRGASAGAVAKDLLRWLDSRFPL
jgi:lysophospholipase